MIHSDVVAYACGDVNGDNVNDMIYLTGIKTADSPMIQNIALVIQNGATNSLYSVELKENMGYNPMVTLRDFTGNGIEDILISIETGGSGGIAYYYIYSFADDILYLLFDFDEYNNQYTYDVNYRDDYKVEVRSNRNNARYLIDISLRDPDYLDEIYDNNGSLSEPIEGWVNPLSGLYPIDFDSDKIYELFAVQRIAGRYNADGLGFVQNTLKWNGDMFDLVRQEIAVFGTED